MGNTYGYIRVSSRDQNEDRQIDAMDQLKIVPKNIYCFLQALFPQKCRLTSSKLHGEFPHYCISSSGTLSGAGEESLQAYKVY